MDKVVEHYERALDLLKEGKREEAAAEFKAGLHILEQDNPPDAASRKIYFATKLAQLYYNDGRFDEARPYFEMFGEKMPKPPSKNHPFKKAIKTLQKTGLLSELTTKELKRLLKEEMEMDIESAEEELELIDFLQLYYAHKQDGLCDRAIKDGFLHHDWRFGQETDDVISEICQLIGKPIYKQIGFREEPSNEHAGTKTFLTVESETKERHSIIIESLGDIIAFINQQLEKLGDKRRFVDIETNGDWFAYYLVDATAYKTIFGGKVSALEEASLPGIDGKAWTKGK